MSSKPLSKKLSEELSRIQADIDKGLKKKKVQNLVLKKILNEVDPDRQESKPKTETKHKPVKY